jgi:hypothetical protein
MLIMQLIARLTLIKPIINKNRRKSNGYIEYGTFMG